jgi:RNA polymerase sigma-70 factor (ECF subfamily)
MSMPISVAKDDSYPTRPSLLRRLKDTQDHQSWQEFSDIYSRLIQGFAIKAGLTEDEAREVVQDTLISTAKHLPGFEYDPKVCAFKTWLLNLSNWRIKDQLRKRRSFPILVSTRQSHTSANESSRTLPSEGLQDPAGPELEALWDQEWRTALLEAALARVKDQIDIQHWQVFDLYALKNWAVKDVARALSLSAGRVYLIKHRVSQLVKREVRRLEKAL